MVYRYDMYEREPWYMVLLAVAMGFALMQGIGYVEEFTLGLFNDSSSAFSRAVVAGTHEECVRLLAVMGLAILIPSQFNDPMDGIIYGCLVGLGMAIDESIFFLKISGMPEHLPPNEVIRLLGHLIMGGITGFGAGMFRMKMKRWLPAMIGCVLFAMALHTLWDLIAFTGAESGESGLWLKLCGLAVMLSGIFFFGFLVVLASEWSRQIFAPNEKHRLWGWPFTLFINNKRDG